MAEDFTTDQVSHFEKFARTKTSESDVENLLKDIGGLQVIFNLILNEIRPQVFDDTVGKIFKSKKGFELLTSPSIIPFICAGLTHEEEYVRVFTITQLTHWTEAQKGIDFLISGPLYLVLLSCLRDPSVEISEEAGRILLQTARSDKGVQKIFNEESQSIVWNKKAESPDTMDGLRAISFFVSISISSVKAFELFQKTIGVATILSMFEKNSSDVLMQMNFLELLNKIVLAPNGSGLNALIRVGAVSSVLKCIHGCFADFLSSGLLDFIEQFVNNQQGVDCTQIVTPALLQFLQSQFVDENDIIKAKAMATIGAISVTLKGFLLLTSHEEATTKNNQSFDLIWKIPPLVSSNQLILVCAAMRVIKDALSTQCSKNESGTNIVSPTTSTGTTMTSPTSASTTSTTLTPDTVSQTQEKIFDAVGIHSVGKVSSMEVLVRILARPIEEARFSAFFLLKAIAKHPWGITRIVYQGGFLEWLLDRKTESTKYGAELKFELLQEIIKNPNFQSDIIAPEIKRSILKYIQQGIFYGTKLRNRDDVPELKNPVTKGF